MTSDRPEPLRRGRGRRADGLPPHDIDAEEALLAAVLLDEEALPRTQAIVSARDFFRVAHRSVYEAMESAAERGEEITHPVVAHELERAGRLDDVGGIAFLFQLTGEYFTGAGVDAHARIVARDAMYRRMIDAGVRIQVRGQEGGPDDDAALAEAEELLAGLRAARAAGDFRALSDLLKAFLSDDGEDEDAGPAVVRTGFMDFDVLLGGLKRGDLVVIAARTSVGKSAFLLNLARNAAVGQGATTAFFTIEMSAEQIAARVLSAESSVPIPRLRLGTHSTAEERRVMGAIGSLGDAPIYIDDSAVLAVRDIRVRCRRLRAESGLDLVLVDYLQLLHEPAQRGGQESRAAELGKITRGLKEIARELDVPVVCAAQLSRAVEQRHPHIPMLSDLRESGSIEQDADVVAFIYREDVYRTDADWNNEYPDPADRPDNVAQLIVAKHRNGPTGTVTVGFEKRTASFYDFARREPEDM